MDIKNFIKTNRLFLAALLVVIVVISIMLSLRGPDISYKMGSEEIAGLLADSNSSIDPIVLFNILSSKSSNAVIVDIRSSDEFGKGHIDKAVNIPVRELLENRSIRFFRELAKSKAEVILYGETQLQANGPWLLLRQIGIENIKVLRGGFAFYNKLPLPDSLLKVSAQSWDVEISQFDSTDFNVSKTEKISVQDKPKPVKRVEKVVPVKQPTSAGGGC